MQDIENLIRRLNSLYRLYDDRRLKADDIAYIIHLLLRDYYEQEKQKEVKGVAP